MPAAIVPFSPGETMGRARAFTLVELLMVIAVLALLLALLSPTLRRAVLQAQAGVCQSNLHQLSLAQAQYSSQCGGQLPAMRTWVGGGSTHTWQDDGTHLREGTLWPLVAREEVYVCPTFARLAPRASRSYSMNWNLGNDREFFPRENLLRISQIRQPWRMLGFGEENPWPISGISRYGIGDGCLLADRWPLRDSLGTFHLPAGDDLDSGLAGAVLMDGSAGLRPAPLTRTLCLQDDWP